MKDIEQIKLDIIDALEGREKSICPNCEEEFFSNRHDEDMCRYLNR